MSSFFPREWFYTKFKKMDYQLNSTDDSFLRKIFLEYHHPQKYYSNPPAVFLSDIIKSPDSFNGEEYVLRDGLLFLLLATANNRYESIFCKFKKLYVHEELMPFLPFPFISKWGMYRLVTNREKKGEKREELFLTFLLDDFNNSLEDFSSLKTFLPEGEKLRILLSEFDFGNERSAFFFDELRKAHPQNKMCYSCTELFARMGTRLDAIAWISKLKIADSTIIHLLCSYGIKILNENFAEEIDVNDESFITLSPYHGFWLTQTGKDLKLTPAQEKINTYLRSIIVYNMHNPNFSIETVWNNLYFDHFVWKEFKALQKS